MAKIELECKVVRVLFLFLIQILALQMIKTRVSFLDIHHTLYTKHTRMPTVGYCTFCDLLDYLQVALFVEGNCIHLKLKVSKHRTCI